MRHNRFESGVDDETTRTVGVGIRPIDIRRAVLGLLMSADEPMRVRDIVVALRPSFGQKIDSQRISDVLRYQVRRGRVHRSGHGRYEFIPGSLSQPTSWRCLHWERERDRVRRRR